MKWAEMSARERDVVIAGTVLGRPDRPVPASEAGGDGAGAGVAGGPEDGAPPPYSREIGAAWRVVEQLNDRTLPDGTRVTLAALDYAPAARAWHAAFQAAMGSARAWTAGAWASLPADALCQAALLVLDYDLDALPEPRPAATAPAF